MTLMTDSVFILCVFSFFAQYFSLVLLYLAIFMSFLLFLVAISTSSMYRLRMWTTIESLKVKNSTFFPCMPGCNYSILLSFRSKFNHNKEIEKNNLKERILQYLEQIFMCKSFFSRRRTMEYGRNCALGPGDLTENIWFGK